MATAAERLARSSPERRPRRAIAAGGGLLLLGLAMVGIDASDAGTAVTLLGVVALLYGIHSYGRLGPD